MNKQFKITSVLFGDTVQAKLNEQKVLNILNLTFRGDERYSAAFKYITKMNIKDEAFKAVSLGGYISVERIA